MVSRQYKFHTPYLPALFFLLLFSQQSLADLYLPIGFGLGVGNSTFDLNESSIVSSYSGVTSSSKFDDESTNFTMFINYHLDENLALEMEYMTIGDITASESGNTTKLFNADTVVFSAMLSKQINDRVNIFAKFGAHLWDISEGSRTDRSINSATDLAYGLGMDINVYGPKSRQLRVQWHHYNFDEVFINDSDSITISILFLLGGYGQE
jgi:hypothetical protein